MARSSAFAFGLLAATKPTTAEVYPFNVMQCQAGQAALQTELMTTCQYRQITNAVISTWSALSTDCNDDKCEQAEWSACVVRMAGHDFLDFKDGQGGSDGCTNLDADDNKGLAQCLYDGNFGLSLSQAWQPFCQRVSLADFFVIAAEGVMMATRRKVEGAPGLDFKSTFKYGRITAQSCPEAGLLLPNPEGGGAEVERVYTQNMGLDYRQAAALSGAHTMGRAQQQNSGYTGWWTGAEHARSFNNQYFVSLLTRGWSPQRSVAGNAGKNQWRISDGDRAQAGKQMMLNTDLSLAYGSLAQGLPGMMNAAATACCAWSMPSTLQAILGQSHKFCGAPGLPPGVEAERALCCDNNPHSVDCDDPSGFGGLAHEHVKEFAENGDSWLSTFVIAWTKATENGMEAVLRPLEPCDGTEEGEETPGLLHFDCQAQEPNWERSWSELKKGFCCKSAGVGCEEDFDCEAGKSNWEKGWSLPKKYHCCKETGLSCDDLFDCDSGINNWKRGWSVLKKAYCCKNENIGCDSTVAVKYDAEAQMDATPSTVMPVSVMSVMAVAGAVLGFLALRSWGSRRRGGAYSVRLVEPDL